MTDFPRQLLAAATAHCQARSGPALRAAITIALQPFSLDGQSVDTCIRLDGIALDLREPRSQAQRSFRFPVNPQDGYIDGSMYLLHRHVPVDVTELSFGTPDEHSLPVHLTATLVFSAAGISLWRDTPITLAFDLELPPTQSQIDAAIASAITATGAQSIADSGRAMAWLVRKHPRWDDRSMLHERIRRILCSSTAPSNGKSSRETAP